MKGLTLQSQENTFKETQYPSLKLSSKIMKFPAEKTLEMMGNIWIDAKDLKSSQELSKVISEEKETSLL